MSWVMLGIAGLMELVFVLFLEKSHKQGKKMWLFVSVGAMIVSIYILGRVTEFIPLGVAYAVWTGLGSLLSVGYGILFLGESKRPLRLFFVLLIVIGVIGIKTFG
ncbi:DMT family transporter [Vagococcus acidifermentans]|uniref:QacE family quaternary ammonium compound efflux SMR transporter n=1 Tax=Vagococcus acidifermentans TaxID=564710 RepID=A0A430B349_9ENTE|nr:multidrug efflux SMR transporter [Vagococcus acidifermentans]RSU14739.1 QacE family quaternary ammonium compound efflux SMR transporter [Vagococcus acidifermentans]